MLEKRGQRWITQECSFEDGRIPAYFGPFIPIHIDEVDSFNDFLSDEIDSAYTSSICCCDFCYEDFKSHWPDIPFRDTEFQTQSADTQWLVDYSRIPGVYSPTEMSTLRGLVQCPRCGRFDPANVYIYEHRFSDADELEAEIDELASVGLKTPFLLLENDFAQRVLAEIRLAFETPETISPGTVLFRARQSHEVIASGQSTSEVNTFGPAPARFVGEGRFNHAGCPVTYVADRADLAAAEIGNPPDLCLVGELEVVRPLQYLDLLEIDEDKAGFQLMSALACSALLAAPHTGEGWIKQQYVFSRFVADCARSAGFDAIRYGSTKLPDGSNFVILAAVEPIDDFFRLVGHAEVACKDPATRY